MIRIRSPSSNVIKEVESEASSPLQHLRIENFSKLRKIKCKNCVERKVKIFFFHDTSFIKGLLRD